MECIHSPKAYIELLNKVKSMNRRALTNNYMSLADITRLITLERLYYDINETGLYLYIDEDQYESLLFYLVNGKMDLPNKREKKLLAKIAYMEKKKNSSVQLVEKLLEYNSFRLYDHSFQLKAEPKNNKQIVQANRLTAEKRIKEYGLSLIYPQESSLNEILKIRNETKELKIFHFHYKTQQEMLANIKDGNVRCLTNENGQICAVQECVIEHGNLTEEWIAVIPEYQNKKGLGSALLYTNFMHMLNQNINVCFAWVTSTNTRSINFHKRNHFIYTGLAVDEWVL